MHLAAHPVHEYVGLREAMQRGFAKRDEDALYALFKVKPAVERRYREYLESAGFSAPHGVGQ